MREHLISKIHNIQMIALNQNKLVNEHVKDAE